mmetsp:Transcript_79247/g.211941  ORF Transcript_79247/g.211941 Transcript_79247/m.211941 type:complete len:276 (+) Transcript_79247:1133-1960(+)
MLSWNGLTQRLQKMVSCSCIVARVCQGQPQLRWPTSCGSTNTLFRLLTIRLFEVVRSSVQMLVSYANCSCWKSCCARVDRYKLKGCCSESASIIARLPFFCIFLCPLDRQSCAWIPGSHTWRVVAQGLWWWLVPPARYQRSAWRQFRRSLPEMCSCVSVCNTSTSLASCCRNFTSASTLSSMRISFTAMILPSDCSKAVYTCPMLPTPMVSPLTQHRLDTGTRSLWLASLLTLLSSSAAPSPELKEVPEFRTDTEVIRPSGHFSTATSFGEAQSG